MMGQFVFDATHPKKGQRHCLFVMSTKQREVFDVVVREMALSSRSSMDIARSAVIAVVTRLLSGKNPTMRDHRAIHKLRLHFPVLTTRQVESLATVGCPEGWIAATNVLLVVDGVKRTAHLAFTSEQAIAYNDCLHAVQQENGATRDAAWVFCNNTVGALVSGRFSLPVDYQPHDIITAMQAAFPTLTEEEMRDLPEVSDEDFRRWSTHQGADE